MTDTGGGEPYRKATSSPQQLVVMELTISRYLLVVVLAMAFLNAIVDGLHEKFSEKELLEQADMYHHSTGISKRSLRSPEETDDHQNQKHRFPDYKHCCGEVDTRNKTGRKETWKAVKECAEKIKAKFEDLENFVNPMTDRYSCKRLKREQNRHYCIADCVLKEVGALQEDGTENKDKVKEFVQKGIAAKWLKEIADHAVVDCIEQKEYPVNGEEFECSPRASNIKHCIWKKIVLNCPDEHFNKSAYCLRVKKAFQEMER